MKRVVRGNLVLTDIDGFAIDIDLSRFLAEFSIGGDTFFDFENTGHYWSIQQNHHNTNSNKIPEMIGILTFKQNFEVLSYFPERL